MFAKAIRITLGVTILTALSVPILGQDDQPKGKKAPPAGNENQPGQFYKKPETVDEYWRYVNHEIELGQFKVAAGYLKGFLEKLDKLDKEAADKVLLQIQEKEGSSAFLRLLTIPETQADARPLVDRVNAVVQKHLSDRKRLDALINQLNAARTSPEERAYAIQQLKRSGAAAVPALVDALLRTADDAGEHLAILSVLPQLDQRAMPPLLAALDIDDANLRSELIDVFRKRGETSATPYLWYLAASPKQPALVRSKAREALAAFLSVKPDQLPAAKEALRQEAERYYKHQVSFDDPAKANAWRWDGKQLSSQALSASQAEEYYGLRFAGQALELDPGYQPAQIVYLSFIMDKGIERAGARDLVRSVNPELVVAVFDRALAEQRLPVILGSVTTLGDLSEVHATRPVNSTPPPLIRALNYPDRRVQMAAAEAVLRIPGPAHPLAGPRVIEILRRALAGEAEAEAKAKVLVAFADLDLATEVAAAVRKAGYDALIVRTGRETLRRLNKAADVDVLLVDSALPDPGLSYLLAQLRVDVNAGHLPLLLTAPGGHEATIHPIIERFRQERLRLEVDRDLGERARKDNQPDLAESYQKESARIEESIKRIRNRFAEESAHIEDTLRRQTERSRNVTVIPLEQARDAKAIAQVLQARLADADSRPLSEAERKDNAAKALEWLARIGRGEVPGYDIRPAEGAILKALHSKELASLAVDGAGGLPGREPQRALATLVLESGQPAELRSKAAIELCRHIQQYGIGLTNDQIKALQALADAKGDAKLKSNVALVIGSLHLDPRQTGERLLNYKPPLVSPAAPATPPKKEEKDAAPKKEEKD